MKTYRPTSAGVRFKTCDDFKDITATQPEKSLLEPIKRTGGRNNHGRITSRHIGGGHKRRYRKIDFKRDKLNIPARVAEIEYDPNRTGRIALLNYLDGEKRYIVAPVNLNKGDTVLASDKEIDINPGNSLRLEHIPMGTSIYNLELKPGKGGQLARSAGTMAQLMGKEGIYALVRLPSGEMRKILLTCRASIGQVSNPEKNNITVGKAGRKRWLGRRPHTRGTVMNPVDHPLGGGHGKDHGGRHPVSPWGQPAKGFKTRNNKLTDKFIVRSRNKK